MRSRESPERGDDEYRDDGADQRDEKGEQRERRHRLDHSHGAKDRLRRARQLCRGDAEGNAHDDARRERHQHQNQVLAGQPPEVRAEKRPPKIAACRARFTGEQRRGVADRRHGAGPGGPDARAPAPC